MSAEAEKHEMVIGWKAVPGNRSSMPWLYMVYSRKDGSAALTPWFIAIGASGSKGMLDIQALLMALRPGIDAVVLIVLHRSFSFPSELPDILARKTGLRVVLARDGERFERGFCYIGEPAAHLSLAARSFGKLVDDPQASHRNRTIDLLFRSVAAHGGQRVIGVILSGALDDGADPVRAVRHRRNAGECDQL
jgi:two-component system chemotaxis response regulator CheB